MFRTEVKVLPSNLNLTIQDSVITIGSCFAEVIGTKLRENKASVLINPFGTIFNPISVAALLSASIGNEHKPELSLVQRDGIWYSYNLHSSFSSPDKEELLQLIDQRIAQTTDQLKRSKLLIITLGTAIGYELSESGVIVANCHKLPAKLFNRKLLKSETIIRSLNTALELIKKFNPDLHIILTVSPVRHVKETLQMNSVSKATLRLASHELSERHPHVHYFPAYEIMLDDLRDYRFYGEDMLHPTSVAEDYIWEKFTTAFYHTSFQDFSKEWVKFRRALSHKPFHPEASAHQAFLKNTLQQLDKLSEKYMLDLTTEKDILLRQITKL